MIQQGRLLHVALNSLTGAIQFIPFFTEFTGAVLYAVSALLYCALFRYVTLGRGGLSDFSLISFCGVYISSSVLVEKYIYHLDVIAVMLSYCCSAVALLYAYRFVKEKRIPLAFCAVAVLMVAIASYETFIFLYICGVFGIFILEIVVNREKKPFLTLLQEGILYALILLFAVVVYYSLVYVVQVLTEQRGMFIRYNYWRFTDGSFFEKFIFITNSFAEYLRGALKDRYLPIQVFLLFTIAGVLLSVVHAIRRKNGWLLACFVALWLCNFGIHYFSGYFMTRAAQTFCFFSGFVLIILIESIATKGIIRKMMYIAVLLLVFIQSADMNRWFYNDYVRYQKETFAINTIATRLVAECDISKPVVFTNYPEYNYFHTELYPGRQANGNSVITWTISAFDINEQPFVSELFRMHGYDFIQQPTAEQYGQAQIEADAMPPWPQKGCIQEFTDFIVVNF